MKIWVQVDETRSHAHATVEDEGNAGTKKHKTENRGQDSETTGKKTKVSGDQNGQANGKLAAGVAAEFDKFCKLVREHLSINEMHKIVEADGQDDSASDVCSASMVQLPPLVNVIWGGCVCVFKIITST